MIPLATEEFPSCTFVCTFEARAQFADAAVFNCSKRNVCVLQVLYATLDVMYGAHELQCQRPFFDALPVVFSHYVVVMVTGIHSLGMCDPAWLSWFNCIIP